jgi:hypothetical protein
VHRESPLYQNFRHSGTFELSIYAAIMGKINFHAGGHPTAEEPGTTGQLCSASPGRAPPRRRARCQRGGPGRPSSFRRESAAVPGPDGALYVSDDTAGAIYRLAPPT